MKVLVKLALLFVFVQMPTAVLATLSVDSLSYPVWVERGSDRVPLAPADRLQPGDVVETGANGRVWLEVEDGSVIKLGQGVRFVVDRAEFRETGQESVLEAAFNVLRGAFRFTSGFFQAQREARHQLDFQVGSVSAGIRGTDIWGRSAEDEDFVILLDGRIEMTSESRDPVIMDQPLTLYRKAENRPVDPVSEVSREAVDQLAVATELDPAAGIASTAGKHSLVLQTLTDVTGVGEALQRFRSVGYAAKTRLAVSDGVTRIHIQLEGLVDFDAADNLRSAMIADGVITDARISPDR